MRIPYSGWRKARADQVRRIDDWFSRSQPPPPPPRGSSTPRSSRLEPLQSRPGGERGRESSTPPQLALGVNLQDEMPLRIELPPKGKAAVVNDRFEWSVISACCQNGPPNADDVLRRAATIQGASRLGPKIRENTTLAAFRLQKRGLLTVEDGEWFLTATGRQAKYVPVAPRSPASHAIRKAPARRRTRRRRSW